MLDPSPLPQAIRDALASGATILAPNERSAAALAAQYDQTQAAAGLHAWEPAHIRSWNNWLNTLWSTLIADGTEPRLLLNPAQEHMLWREVIAADPAGQPLSSADTLADLASTAFRLAASYEALPDLRRYAHTHDARTFADWAAGFIRRCHQRQLLSSAELASTLRTHIEAGTLTAPASLVLVAFDEDTPARSKLLHTLSTHNGTITRLDPNLSTNEDDLEDRPEHPGWPNISSAFRRNAGVSSEARPLSSTDPLHFVVRAQTPQDELTSAAQWLRDFTQNHPTPAPRIALIIPTLAEEREAIESTLRDVLSPELQSIHADLSSTPFSFATGAPLAATPIITTALDLLRWSTAPLPLDRVSALLLSPYLGALESLPERASFDAHRLRQTSFLRPELSIPRVLQLSAKHPAITTTFGPVASRLARLSTTNRSFADWMEFFRDLLRDAGFPGNRPLNAAGFHHARSWDRVLDTVATLDFAGIRVDLQTALAALEREVRQAHTRTSATPLVQVMTPAEAVGATFDAILFLRCTDANWPTPERPNPLLGWSLQRDRQMPGTHPAHAAARAEAATTRLIASAPSTLFFYAEEDESGPQRLSPIIERLAWPQTSTADLIAPTALATIPIEEFEDSTPLPALPQREVPGGARVLKQQAACGFLAFAELRLRSKPIDEVTAGLDALESGNLLHRAMQTFWSHLHSQDELRRLDPADREILLARCIDNALQQGPTPETSWDASFLQLQKDRLLYLLRAWLLAELERDPFTVLYLEQQTEVSVGPLTLSVRMDRIDRLGPGHNNGFVYVDYKTGYAASPAHWEGERPEDPQLPLYALLSEPGELKALTFAKVRPGKGMAWAGYQAEPGILPQKRPVTVDLDILIDEWRQNLAMLAEDFANGRATVSPRDFAIDCARCAQRLLCRVNPETLLLNPIDPIDEVAEVAE